MGIVETSDDRHSACAFRELYSTTGAHMIATSMTLSLSRKDDDVSIPVLLSRKKK